VSRDRERQERKLRRDYPAVASGTRRGHVGRMVLVRGSDAHPMCSALPGPGPPTCRRRAKKGVHPPPRRRDACAPPRRRDTAMPVPLSATPRCPHSQGGPPPPPPPPHLALPVALPSRSRPPRPTGPSGSAVRTHVPPQLAAGVREALLPSLADASVLVSAFVNCRSGATRTRCRRGGGTATSPRRRRRARTCRRRRRARAS
jgi:hypothetical protein